jgi:hypothetical protein
MLDIGLRPTTYMGYHHPSSICLCSLGMASPWGFTIQPLPIKSQCGDNYSLKKIFKILLELSYNLENLLKKVEAKDINPSFFLII